MSRALLDIIEEGESLVRRMESTLLAIYNKNTLSEGVERYMSNEALREYLTSYRADYGEVVEFEETAEFALFVLKMAQVKEKVRLKAEEKYKAISIV